MQALLKSFARKMLYVFAAIVLLVAALIVTARLLTPVFDKHRDEIVQWASQLLDMPVTIQNMNLSWYGYQPEVTLNHVTAYDKINNKPALEINKIRVFFSIPKSLWEWKPVPSTIMVVGTSVVVQQTATGELVLQGFSSLNVNQQPLDSETKFIDVINWLSTQPRLILRDIDVHYTGYRGQQRFITLYDLSLENAGQKHTILGKAILHQDVPTEAKVIVQWTGQRFDLAQIHAHIYVYVTGLSLAQWWKGLTWQGWQLNNGMASARIWATWNNNMLRKIQATARVYGLDLNSLTNKATHSITRISGNVGWRREGETQIFAGDDILIDLPVHLWPVTNFYAQWASDTKGGLIPKTLNVGYLDVGDVQSFLFSSPPLFSDNVMKMLRDLKLTGNLQNANLVFNGGWNEPDKIHLTTQFHAISFEPLAKFPGVTNLSGRIDWQNNAGNVVLNSNRFVFNYTPVFAQALQVDQLTGDINFKHEKNKTWQLQIASLQVLNRDAAANVRGNLYIPDTGSSVIDLNANFTLHRAARITRYLPEKVFDKELITWLKQAFLAGEVKSANAVLRGPLNDFPFDKQNGKFLVEGEIKDVDLHYAPDWPVLKNINAKLKFSGREMAIDAVSAQLLNIPITNLQAVIPYLGEDKPAILTIKNTTIKTDLAEAIKFLHNSPLQQSLGKMFVGARASGPIILNLGLTIPVKDPDKTAVRGQISLNDAQINLEAWKLALTKLNGQIAFTEDSASAQGVKGLLFNKPFLLNLMTTKTKNNDVIEASFTNQLSIDDLEEWLKVPFSKVVRGRAEVAGKVAISWKAPIQIHLQSNLAGISVDANAPYGKKVDEISNFTADIELPGKQPLRMKLGYNNLLSAALVLENKQNKFNLVSANLKLGGGDVSWPAGDGLYITGSFDRLDWDKIKTYLNQAQGGGTMSKLPLPLRSINIDAKQLSLFGQAITEANLQVQPAGKNWNVTITSAAIAGQLQIPANFSAQGVMNAQFQKLRLQSVSSGQAPAIDAKTLPAINFSASDVSYNDMELGQVNFKTVPSGNGLNIEYLVITNSNMDIRAEGDWMSDGTHLHGRATSTNVSDLLNNLGFAAHNLIASSGNLNFDLNWHAAPYAPSLAGLNGDAQMELGKGRVVEVGTGTGAQMGLGRMLSIFSLQSIPRRLSGDFSDLFQQGYSFDSVRGDFTFKNGDAFTNNMRIEGPMAKVTIDGRIGLKNKDYNFVLSVTPYVTSSLPLAAAWIGGPVTGLAALAVNTVLGSQVSKMIATYQYLVTGSWDDPSWQPMSTPQRQQQGQ